ncbi:MAG TPA: DNA (cytosine-5-)-methyltransferase [Gaiellaceae bacterium]|nr:DNA (cytosine-5-)-methyltransferase [Gaiellaceae bacterium]
MNTIAIDQGGLLERIDELLEATYRSADLGNMQDPLAETIYIVLSKQTREAVYRRVYAELRQRYPRWTDLLEADPSEIEKLVAPAGFQRQRTEQLLGILEAVAAANREHRTGPWATPRPQDLNLEFLRELEAVDAERFLKALPGIGPKSARCVMAYALERPTFAVDTHVHRIFVRLGLVKSNGRKRDHDPFQDVVPPTMRKRLHINLVHHGRAVCRTRKARCAECVLVSFCDAGRKAVAARSGPVAVDLFAGAGGLGHGFRKAGFRIGLAVEPNRHAAQTYRLNNPGVPVIEAKIDESTDARSLLRFMPSVKRIAALLAGPPCQGYSAAGARRPHASVNRLYRHVSRLAKDLMVEVVCLENVPGVQRVNGHGFLNTMRNSLRRAGFATEAHLVHACEYGVPQHRARYFFLGKRGEEAPPRPPPTHRPPHAKQTPETTHLPATPRLIDLLSQLPAIDTGVVAERFTRADGQEDYNLSTMAHGPAVVRKIREIKPGSGPISYRRLERGEARTLIAGHRAMPVHPTRHRTISVREAAVIQGFPRNYIFCGPRAEQPLQVANAVPPPLAEAVARTVLICLKGTEAATR